MPEQLGFLSIPAFLFESPLLAKSDVFDRANSNLSKLQKATVQTLAKRTVLSMKAENAQAQSGRSHSFATTDTKVIGMFHTPMK